MLKIIIILLLVLAIVLPPAYANVESPVMTSATVILDAGNTLIEQVK